MWARWLLLCALGALLAGAGGSLLPPVARRLLGRFQHLVGGSRVVLGKEEGRFEAPVDFRKLPPNYHTEEKEQRRVGNATVYSHREINKVTDNETGAMLFSDRTVTSIEQGERGLAERWRGCLSDHGCRTAQFCSSSLLASQCWECKAKDTVCQWDRECCLGYLCVWGKCAEGVSPGEGLTRFSTMSMRHRPEGNMDLRGLGQQLSFLQPSLALRDEEDWQLANQLGQYFGPGFY
ncbi:transaldolase [Platysternon megacephalum]|uniref:Transaldolase n=1 Tax=Platysternon megacephalum TaxID=55544 RepID=A0A4D9DFF0_9SAUR|nr:transaldolase [Platysternon megacephalum]